MGRLDPDILEEIKDRVDIVQLISRYVPLKRAGKNFKALCPFHNEKTPSFSVSPEKQLFHCFGCGVSGDIFQFLMKMENLTFTEALELLAQEAGVKLPTLPRGSARRDRLYELHEEATRIFHRHLLSPEGVLAREVALARGMGPEAWDRFSIGYAPDDWDLLREELKAKGFSNEEMVSVGFLGEREWGEPYVKFRHRLMIPIWDAKGRVVAFGGRALDHAQEPKYLNSPEHSLFKKGDVLYPYHLARKKIGEMGYLLLVEGYMDAITCHLNGFPNTVAAMGTSLTSSQVQRMVRLSKEVFLAYDGDEAGRKAAIRSAALCFKVGVIPRLLLLPDGEDPDSFIRGSGSASFADLVAQAEDVILWFMEDKARMYDLTHPRARAQWLTEVVEFLSPLEDPLLLESYLSEAASRAGVTLEALKAKLHGRGSSAPRGTSLSGSWDILYLALALTRREWWSSFDGKGLRDPKALELWEKMKEEADPSLALSCLDDDEKALLVGRAMEVPWEDMEEVYQGCSKRAMGRLMEEEAKALKRRMREIKEEERIELLRRYMTLMRSIKGLKEEGLYETH